MNFEDFEEGALTTWNGKAPKGTAEGLCHAALGLCGEAGEVADIIKKVVSHDHPFTEEVKAKLVKEVGDALYYTAILAYHLEVPLEEIAILNRKKLSERYGQSFSTSKSLHRENEK